ncbi:MAG: flavin reductase family protein [Ideonella sp.]|nr:flavin reductase family protein [Ideonella sp.]MCC7456466.1 flavin reductase family protein [Nitrospira sp.]
MNDKTERAGRTRFAELSKLLSSLPCPETLLCVRAGEVTDVAAVTTMWVSYDPVIVAVYLRPGIRTHKLVNEGRQFTLNVVDEAQNPQALLAGSLKGDDPDKLKKLALQFEPAASIDSPRVSGAAASYECRVLKVAACGDHDLFLGLVTGWNVRDGGKPVVRWGGHSHAIGATLEAPAVKYPH